MGNEAPTGIIKNACTLVSSAAAYIPSYLNQPSLNCQA
uniref:Uncharacterized protein n=1 Tax=Arundo donax TaxID=35708 RepID=A0A0A9C7F2_ARUDO